MHINKCIARPGINVPTGAMKTMLEKAEVVKTTLFGRANVMHHVFVSLLFSFLFLKT